MPKEIFLSAAQGNEAAPDWIQEMEASFKAAHSGGKIDISSLQKTMDSVNAVYKEGAREGLERFLTPVPGKAYCGLDQESWQNKIERLFPDLTI